MEKVAIKIPKVGESVQEAYLAEWYKQDGEIVNAGEPLLAFETDKISAEVAAGATGVLKHEVNVGETVPIDSVVGTIEPDTATQEPPPKNERSQQSGQKQTETQTPAAEPRLAAKQSPKTHPQPSPPKSSQQLPPAEAIKQAGPAVRRLLAQHQLDIEQITGSGPGGRVCRSDVIAYLESRSSQQEAPPPREAPAEEIRREPMSPIRQRIAQRLLQAKQNTAMLTTFNEVDMSRIQEMRALFQQAFQDKHQIKLGLMSFFVKAAITALQKFPRVNAYLDGKDIVYHHYYHIGIAIGGERGLVVPVVRHAERLSYAEIEKSIRNYIEKIAANQLQLQDLEGGTFTISNGGIYGSLLSTPILNTPQSGILGMHKIEERPVVIAGQIQVRPMMYLAFSYDHRIIDGRESVGFLSRIKECLENPERIMLEI